MVTLCIYSIGRSLSPVHTTSTLQCACNFAVSLLPRMHAYMRTHINTQTAKSSLSLKRQNAVVAQLWLDGRKVARAHKLRYMSTKLVQLVSIPAHLFPTVARLPCWVPHS